MSDCLTYFFFFFFLVVGSTHTPKAGDFDIKNYCGHECSCVIFDFTGPHSSAIFVIEIEMHFQLLGT